jgi:hypothetical protein
MDFASAANLSMGMIHDAVWLRMDSLKRSLAGTPALCLGSLFALTVLLPGLSAGIAGARVAFRISLMSHLGLSLVTGLLLSLVTLTTTSAGVLTRVFHFPSPQPCSVRCSS